MYPNEFYCSDERNNYRTYNGTVPAIRRRLQRRFPIRPANYGQRINRNGRRTLTTDVTCNSVEPFCNSFRYFEQENLNHPQEGPMEDVIEKGNHCANICDRMESSIENDGNSWHSYFEDFCQNTTLHGFRYFTGNNNWFIEKYFGYLSASLAFILCGILISCSVQRLLSTPVMISVENLPTSVRIIPFPAVTVCSSNQIKPSFFNMTKILQSDADGDILTDEDLQKADYVSVLCRRAITRIQGSFIKAEVIDHMITNAHTKCEETLKLLKWQNDTYEKPCSKVQTIMTELGLCHTFNLLPLKQLLRKEYYEAIRNYTNEIEIDEKNYAAWNNDHQKLEDFMSTIDYPVKADNYGSLLAITLDINSNNCDPTCTRNSLGAAVLMHAADEMPSAIHAKLSADAGSLKWIVVEPSSVLTSPDLYLWPPNDRGCYFHKERRLRYFALYTQHNCNVECESNYTYSICGCVMHHHPRDLSIPICGPAKFDCVEDALTGFSMKYDDDELCNCLTSCSKTFYNVKTITRNSHNFLRNPVRIGRFDNYINNSSVLASSYNGNLTSIEVSYRELDIQSYNRVQMQTFVDFVGNIGGIAQLFLGFSWISLLEVMYFFVFKPLLNRLAEYRHYRNQT